MKLKHQSLDVKTGELTVWDEEVAEFPKLAEDGDVALGIERATVVAACARLRATFDTVLASGRPTPGEVAVTYLPALAEDFPVVLRYLERMMGG